MNYIKCFNNMTHNERLDYISEHNGHIQDNIGVNSDGHYFSCDCDIYCSELLRIK